VRRRLAPAHPASFVAFDTLAVDSVDVRRPAGNRRPPGARSPGTSSPPQTPLELHDTTRLRAATRTPLRTTRRSANRRAEGFSQLVTEPLKRPWTGHTFSCRGEQVVAAVPQSPAWQATTKSTSASLMARPLDREWRCRVHGSGRGPQ
jgi:hypothetical protein